MRLFFALLAVTLFLSSCTINNDKISINGTSTNFEGRSLPTINEIMFEPIQHAGDEIPDQPDFIEIYNPGNETVDLRGWHIQDCPDTNGRRYSYYFAVDAGADNLLAPGQYAVVVPEEGPERAASRLVEFYDYLAGDLSVRVFIVERKTFSFNNDADCVTLKDAEGAVIDSVSYDISWHNPYLKSTNGRSIEKFNDQLASSARSSWSSSSDMEYGATPGRRNSIYLSADDLNRPPSLTASPSSFSPDMDGGGETTRIAWELPAGAYRIELSVYDSEGRAVRTLAAGLPAGPAGAMEWNGLDDNGKPALSGIYLVRLSVSGNAFDGTGELEETVVLAR